LAFVKVDVSLDSVSGTTQLSVAGRPFSNTDAFRDHLLHHLEPGFRVSQGGGRNLSSNHAWTASSTGYFTPILISQLGDVFSLGSQMNRDGRVHINWIGDGVYAFEDLSADQGSDFDYNDAVMVVRKQFSSSSKPNAMNVSAAANEIPRPGQQDRVIASLGSQFDPFALNQPRSDDFLPLQAEVLGLSAAYLSSADNQELPSPQPCQPDLADPTAVSSAGDNTSLPFAPVHASHNRLGEAAGLWKHVSSSASPQPVTLEDSLQIPVDGPDHPANQPTVKPEGVASESDPFSASIASSELSVGMAIQAEEPTRLPTTVASSLGSDTIPLEPMPFPSSSETLEQLSSDQVGLALPDDNVSTWVDEVVGVDSLPLAPANSAALLVSQSSGISSFEDLTGSRLGLIGIASSELSVDMAIQAEEPTRLPTTVASSLGSDTIPLEPMPFPSSSETLEQLSNDQVGLARPDDNVSTWVDGVVSVDSLPLAPANSAALLVSRSSGISSFEDLAGSRLGLIGVAKFRAAMSLNLSRHNAQAAIHHFSDIEQARHALQAGQLDGLVLMRDSVSAVQSWLESNGFDSQLLQDRLLASMCHLYLAPNQSRLRDVLLAAKVKMQLENS
jgi:hypothetical protein